MQFRVWRVALLIGCSVMWLTSLAAAARPSSPTTEKSSTETPRDTGAGAEPSNLEPSKVDSLNAEAPNDSSPNTADIAPDDIARLTAELRALEAKIEAMEGAGESPDTETETRLSALEKLIHNTSFGGRMYANYTYLNHKDSLTGKSDRSGTGLDVKRFYFDVEHRFDDTWSVALTTDITYSSATKTVTPFVKKAYLEGKFAQEAVLRVGAASTPWVPFAEKYYGYRYIENTIADRRKAASSADWGVHLSGDIGENKRFNYAVSAVTGHGYKNPTRSKGMDVEARIGVVPVQGMVIAAGGYIGFRGQNLQNADVERTAQRLNLMLAYANERFRVGGEYFLTNNWENIATTETDSAYGVSLWGSVNLPANFGVFGRYDHTKTSRTLNPDAKNQYYNAGLEYTIRDGINLALVYKREVDTLSDEQTLTIDEAGLFVQAKF